MEIILSKQCESLVGMLERGLGYYIRSSKTGRFFSQRSRHSVPPDGHWRFIVLCAEIARNHLYISDIQVSRKELVIALWRAGRETLADYVFTEPDKFPKIFSANDIINFRRKYLPNQA